MQSTITPADGSSVKVVIDIDEVELEPSLNTAFDKISKEVRIPGFRQGRVPRKVLEAKLGRSYIRSEAINEAVPGFLEEIIKENDLDVIATPNVNITSGEDSGPIVLEADIQVRPEVKIDGYLDAKVTVPSPLVTDSDISEQIKRLREQFGELKEVERPVALEDQVSIDVKAERDGEPIPGLSVEDFLYKVGGESFIPGLDAAVTGLSVGEEASFEVAPPEGSELTPISCTVVVKKINELILPDLNDEWASEASEFSTLHELEDSIREQLDTSKKSRSSMAFRDRAVASLVELMDLAEIPPSLIQSEFDRLIHDFSHRLEAQGIPLEQYLSVTGTSSDQLVNQILTDAEAQAKADLALRALIREEKTEVSSADLEKELAAYAENAGVAIEVFREQITSSGQLKLVELEMAKAKALDAYLEKVEVVDEDGNPVERQLLLEEEDSEASSELEESGDDVTQVPSGSGDNDGI